MPDLETMRKASELLQKGRYDDAIAEYRAILESSRKKNPSILNLIGDIQAKQGRFEKAFDAFLEACRLYAEEGLFHNGIAVGKKVLRMDRDQTELYGILGNLYARQGLGGDCVKFLREYARRKDEAGEYNAALASFAEACEILKNFPEVHVEYGEMLERVDRKEDAAARFNEAARLWAERGITDRAAEWQRRAAALGGEELPAASESQANMRDIMSLRTLEDTPPSTVVPPGESESRDRFWGRVDPPGTLDLRTPSPQETAPWQRYDPERHPTLRPPPPLPPRRATAKKADGLTLETVASAPPSTAPIAPAPASPAPLAPPAAETAPASHDLSELPGIVMPPPGARTPSGSMPAPDAQDDALAAFFEATSSDPTANEQAVAIGDDLGLIEGRDVSEVIADFRAATLEILDLDDHQAHYDLGTTFMEMELFEEAAAEFEIAARGADFALPSQEMLGYCFLRQGKIELAIRELERGMAIPVHDPRAKLGLLYNLGIACSVLDREEDAIAHFRSILNVDPNFRDTQERLERLVQSAS